MHNGDLTPKERLTDFDDDEKSLVVMILVADDCFQEKARTIAAADPEDRTDKAEDEASSYTTNRGAHREAIIELLLDAADEPWHRKGIPPQMFFANRVRRAVWCDSPLDELDPRRARPRWKVLEDGARAVARFGAFECIGCGRPLGHDRYDRSASRRRSRRTHCSQCWEERRWAIPSQVDAMRKALDVLTGRRCRQRARRRVT